ncbi:MAG: fatty acid desaturase, partial [Xanthobacteraceae bacterium]
MPQVVQEKSGVAPVGQVRGFGGEAVEMAVLSPRLIVYNLAYLVLAWAVAVGAMAVFWVHPAWYTFALAFLVVSSRQQALLNCEHECAHGKFLPGRGGNAFAGRWLSAAAVGSPFAAARARHLAHHRLLGSPEDPDHVLHAGEDKRSRRGVARHLIGAL